MNALRHRRDRRRTSAPTTSRSSACRSSAAAEDEERVRNNPRITLEDGEARPASSATTSTAVAAQAQRAARVAYARTSRSTASQVQGVVARLHLLLDLQRRARPADQPGRSRLARPVADVLGWQTSPTGCSARPIRSTRSSRSAACTSASSASARRRDRSSASSQDEFAIIPLGEFRRCSAPRFGMQLLVKPKIAASS